MMGTESEIKYLNFPVQLLEGFLKDKKKVLLNIVYYALVDAKEAYNGTSKNVAFRILDSWGIIEYKDNRKNWGVIDEDRALDYGNKLHREIGNKAPMTGIKLSQLKEFLYEEKGEFECVCLLAFLAAKSILINKPFNKITKMYLLSRMDGKVRSLKDPSSKDFVEGDEKVSPEIFEYYGRYKFDKLKQALLGWNLVTYSQGHKGFFISIELPLSELAYHVEKNKLEKKRKDETSIRSLMKKAKQDAMSRLSSENILN